MLERLKSSFYWGLGLVLVLQCCNPFAPALEPIDPDPDSLLGNRRTIDGVFEWFKNSYELKDTTLYGQIIHPLFTFTYFDFANSNEVSWDRQTEMETTYRMFSNVKNTSLQWNHYLTDTVSNDTSALVERAFNLTIVQEDQNIFRGTGSALIGLRRKNPQSPWKIVSWYDRSDF